MECVWVRFRPVMMTAFGTIAGMIPIALEQSFLQGETVAIWSLFPLKPSLKLFSVS